MTKKVLLALVLLGSLFSLLWLASSQSHSSPASSVPSKEVVSAKLATIERGWVKNEGQWDERALFSAPGYFGNTWITKDGQLLHVAVKKEECKEKVCPSKSWIISERWVGGKVRAIKGEEELQTKVSYFIGNDPFKHKTNLPTYRYVSLGEVWSGVEVKLKATQKTVEKLFYIKPGADPSKIQVQVDGAKGLKLSKDGEIIIQTGLGELKLSKPVAWQEMDGKKLPVEVSYKLLGKNRYSFKVAKADLNLPLVIDPILQATYLGGNGQDEAYAIAIHPTTGEVYVAGQTWSHYDFPNTNGGAQEKGGSAFVARLNSNLTQIFQSTYLGGSRGDRANALAIHPTTGEVYVAGVTRSVDFPTPSDGAQTYYGGGPFEAFVVRLNKELTRILQSTYLGGDGEDGANAIAIHPTTGELYVAGWTNSRNFPKTDSGAQRSISSYNISDAFVARLNKELTKILQSTYLGGRDRDWANALAIHPTTGEVYVTGVTRSVDFPGTTAGAQEAHRGGDYDAFVAKLSSDLTRLIQSTYLGGNGNDQANALAIHPTTGEIYVAGETESSNFTGTNGGAQAVHGGGRKDAFVARLNQGLTRILQSTYLGGSDHDLVHALAIHPTTGEIYVAGETYSADFPHTTGGAQRSSGGHSDAFVARLNQGLTRILQSTYLGGSDEDVALTIAIHPKTGDVYVAGKTKSTNFPNTAGGAQASNRGGTDAFVARLSAELAADKKSSGGGGYHVTNFASSMVSMWNILLLLSVPAFVLAGRIRRR